MDRFEYLILNEGEIVKEHVSEKIAMVVGKKAISL